MDELLKMTLSQLNRRKKEHLKNIANFQNILSSPVLKLNDKQIALYKSFIQDEEEKLEEINSALYLKRKRW